VGIGLGGGGAGPVGGMMVGGGWGAAAGVVAGAPVAVAGPRKPGGGRTICRQHVTLPWQLRK
jgi:hypothetical protein